MEKYRRLVTERLKTGEVLRKDVQRDAIGIERYRAMLKEDGEV